MRDSVIKVSRRISARSSFELHCGNQIADGRFGLRSQFANPPAMPNTAS